MNPLHIDKGELKTFDIVIANPPFSQNYSKDGMKFKERFNFWMPVKSKADFIFVQHMVASLNNAGRMAVVMPHGVLFRGGDERNFRKSLIDKGYLEVVIGLPPALFYGTSIPASVIVINKKDAHLRDQVLFINADREYKEGKVQNKLRAEDIEKIAFAYRHKKEIPQYSKLVTKEDLAAEEYNLNIRRFVDNAPPAEPQDVHAHLHGGIPIGEVNNLDILFASYPGLRERLFDPLKDGYLKFAAAIDRKEDIKKLLDDSPEIRNTVSNYHNGLQQWWNEVVNDFELLPTAKNVFELYRKFSESFTEALSVLPFGKGKGGTVLDIYQSRGALAAYWNELNIDLKSVAASGWNAELIPDDEIIESQFPEVLKELRANEARREELEAMFTEVNELEEEVWQEDEYAVWPAKELKAHKEALKALKGERKEADKEYKNLQKRIKAGADEQELKATQHKLKAEIAQLDEQIMADEARFAKHTGLEEELKQCKKIIKQIKDKQQALVDQARILISDEQAKDLILVRWKRVLDETIGGYLQAHRRKLLLALEKLQTKYTLPLHVILEERDQEAASLENYFVELGYE
ncbi:N-6 DNA Methylase [Ostertagia ostertagi]